MKLNRLFSIAFFSFICAFMQAQTIKLSGVIKDEKGNPIRDVSVIELSHNKGTTSNDKGEYHLNIPSEKKVSIYFSHVNYKKVEKKISAKNDIELHVKLKNKTLKTLEVEYVDPGSSPIELLPTIDASNIALPSSNIEGLLSSIGFGVRQNNELSSGFNVRGGNFDENLIYVNGIEVYRPFLARSGQQEGLSFINPSMIENILFSAGGFDAIYGDKLSSVLDITYREPKSFGANITTSLLGAQFQIQDKINNRLNYNVGVRYRTNAYLLGALDTKGEYKPRFTDVQGLINYQVNEDIKLSYYGSLANNLFSVQPENRETNFGSINEALRFTVYYEGQENTQFKTWMSALTLKQRVSEKLNLNYFVSTFNTDETEFFDVLGEYRLDELERDLGSDEYGQVAYNRGVGAFLNHARNELKANVYNIYHKGDFQQDNSRTNWGVKFQRDYVTNNINEWNYIDSSRFNTPKPSDSIGYTNPANIPYQYLELSKAVHANTEMNSSRITGFLQHRIRFNKQRKIELLNPDSLQKKYVDTSFFDDDYFTLTVGIRGNHWTYNQQTVFSPRINFKWKPAIYKFENNAYNRRNITLRAATGYYYQPPFFRAARNLSGELNPGIRAQKSIHFVLGGDMVFDMWGRKFKAGSELYYKLLHDIIPYEIENVRVNYYGENNATGYARGIDFKINGEFVKGIQSYASLSWLQTKEDITNDGYYHYFNANGEKIVPGYTLDNIATDSSFIEPGYIPRPTDQRLSFSLFFQDEMPDDWDTEKIKWSTMKLNINILFGTRLPYGPPGNERFSDTLRSSLYRRIDIGFSKDLIQSTTDKSKYSKKSIIHKIDAMWIAFEVFNLLDISNTTNYTWINDVSGRKYSVPSFLTSRRLNLKLVARF